MGRKTGWRVLAICLLFVFLVGSCGCARKAPPEKPPKAGEKVPQPETVERQESNGEKEGGGMPEESATGKTAKGYQAATHGEGNGGTREKEKRQGGGQATEAGDREEEIKSGETEEEKGYQEILANMTLEEQVAQLFIVEPEQLTGEEKVTQAGQAMKDALAKYPVGGMIYFAGNLQDGQQLKGLTQGTQDIAVQLGMPPLFLSVDEEGGSVARIGNRKSFSVPKVPAMAKIGATGDEGKAREAGEAIGTYLAEYGINLNFAPDADVLTNPENQVVKSRSFGSDPKLVGRMVLAYMEGLEAKGICSVPKHFPGHGGTKEDSHEKLASMDKTWEQLEEAELVPFRLCVKKQAPFIMVGHISLPLITGGNVPCSLSPLAMDGYLREAMGYEGIIITDALSMGAIEANYPSEEAAVLALEAGADMLLMPKDLPAAYDAVLEAVKQGRISRRRLEDSVLRIIRVKKQYLSF